MSIISMINSALILEDSPYSFCPGTILRNAKRTIRINNLLGEGCFGKVYSVSIAGTKRRFALKTVPLNEENLGEVRILNLLRRNQSHKYNIVDTEVSFAERISGRTHICILMERMGISLEEFLKCRDYYPFVLRDVRAVGKQILKALKHLSKLGVIHADLKPSNLLCTLLTPNLEVKLADFGNSGLLDAVQRRGASIQAIGFRAPEILFDLPFDERIDVFSLGAVLAEMYIGRALFPAESDLQLARFQFDLIGTPANGHQTSKFEELYSVNPRTLKYEPKPFIDLDYRMYNMRNVRDIVKYGRTANGLKETTTFVFLLEDLLAINLFQRPTAKEALQMDFFKS